MRGLGLGLGLSGGRGGKATLTIESVGTQDGNGDLPIEYVIDRNSSVRFWFYPAAEDDPTTVAELSSAPFVYQGAVTLTVGGGPINLDIVGTLSGSVKGVALVANGGNSDLVVFGPFTLASAAITATYVTGVADQANPDFGSLSAGWYAVCGMLRGETINSITPPGQSAVTPTVHVVGSQSGNRSTAAIFLVELTAARSGAWTGSYGTNTSRGWAIYSLSGQPAVPVSGEFATAAGDNGSAGITLAANTSAGSAVIAASHVHDGTVIADDGTDLVSRNFYDSTLSNHRPAAFSGVAVGGTPEAALFKQTSPNFRAYAACVLALKPV